MYIVVFALLNQMVGRKNMPNYPKLRQLMESAIANLENRRGAQISGRLMGRELKQKGIEISHASVNSWRLGQQTPKPELHGPLAEYLSDGDSKLRDQYLELLGVAVAEKEELSPGDPSEELYRQKISLRIGVVDPWPFTSCDGAEGLLDVMLYRSALGAGFNPERESRRLTSSQVRTELFHAGGVHVVAGWPQTTVREHCGISQYRTPIRVPLNGVVLSRTVARRDKTTRNLLCIDGAQGGAFLQDLWLPVVQKDGIGWIYTTKTLRIRETSITVVPDSLEGYIAALELSQARYVAPVVLADEFTCLRLLAELKGVGELLFPLRGTDAWFAERVNRPLFAYPPLYDLPVFPLGFAVNGSFGELTKNVSEMIEDQLDNGDGWVLGAYTLLYHRLAREAEILLSAANLSQNASKDAAAWSRFILTIDFGKDSYHGPMFRLSPGWESMLRLVRQRVRP